MQIDPHTWRIFLSSGIAICSFLVILNLFLYRKRGASSLILASGCVFLGFLFYALLQNADQYVISILASLLVLTILIDIILKAKSANNATSRNVGISFNSRKGNSSSKHKEQKEKDK